MECGNKFIVGNLHSWKSIKKILLEKYPVGLWKKIILLAFYLFVKYTAERVLYYFASNLFSSYKVNVAYFNK